MAEELLEGDLGTPISDETPVEKTEEELEIEAQARRMGWRPLEEFARPPERWVDAKTFIEHGMQELPVLRNRYRHLDKQLSTANTELTTVKQQLSETNRVMNEVREMAKSAEDRAYIRALRELSQRERDAVSSADTAAYEQIQRERQDLEQTRPRTPTAAAPAPVPAPAPPAPAANPEVESWVADNASWFKNDPLLNQVAIGYNTQIQQDHPEWGVVEQLAETKRQVMLRFPEKFPQMTNTRRAAPSAVATSNTAPARPKGKTLKDYPKEYQEAYARFKKQMPTYTEAEYIAMVGEI